MKSLGPILILLFVLVRIISAVMTASKKGADNEAQLDETEEQKRMREIRESIRRKIAERRGGTAPVAPPQMLAAERDAESPPPLRPTQTPQLDPFGGPMQRGFIPTERKVAPVAAAPEPTETAILERQQRLAEEMRALEAARLASLRRAAQVTADKQTADDVLGVPAAARASWRAELRSPANLRRAFVLREVLGPPVGLR